MAICAKIMRFPRPADLSARPADFGAMHAVLLLSVRGGICLLIYSRSTTVDSFIGSRRLLRCHHIPKRVFNALNLIIILDNPFADVFIHCGKFFHNI